MEHSLFLRAVRQSRTAVTLCADESRRNEEQGKAMIILTRQVTGQLRALIRLPLALFVLTILSVTTNTTFARSPTSNVPENAHKKSYGTGWECDRGFQERDGACLIVAIPENAYPTDQDYGQVWKCSRGFLREGKVCAAVRVPANAYLISFGNGWDCDRGFKKPTMRVPLLGCPTTLIWMMTVTAMAGNATEDLDQSMAPVRR